MFTFKLWEGVTYIYDYINFTNATCLCCVQSVILSSNLGKLQCLLTQIEFLLESILKHRILIKFLNCLFEKFEDIQFYCCVY